MTITEQQAGATEREAVERLSEWMWPNCDRHFLEDGTVFITPTDAGPGDLDVYFAPFTAEGERELLTVVQERWGRPACEDGEMPSARMWAAFSARIEEFASAGLPAWSSRFLLAYIAPGDIARAVDAVLRQYPESA